MSARFTATLVILMVLAVLIGVLAGRSQPVSTAAPAPTATPTPLPVPPANHVFIEASGSTIAFVPGRLVVHVGQKVTWVNMAGSVQSVTADNGAFNQELSPGQSFAWHPHNAGTYGYGSFLDPNARGTVVVQP